MRQISRHDVELGRIEPRRIENGVTVPPALQINAETCTEHQRRMLREGRRLLSRAAAAEIFPADEVEKWFAREPS